MRASERRPPSANPDSRAQSLRPAADLGRARPRSLPCQNRSPSAALVMSDDDWSLVGEAQRRKECEKTEGIRQKPGRVVQIHGWSSFRPRGPAPAPGKQTAPAYKKRSKQWERLSLDDAPPGDVEFALPSRRVAPARTTRSRARGAVDSGSRTLWLGQMASAEAVLRRIRAGLKPVGSGLAHPRRSRACVAMCAGSTLAAACGVGLLATEPLVGRQIGTAW